MDEWEKWQQDAAPQWTSDKRSDMEAFRKKQKSHTKFCRISVLVILLVTVVVCWFLFVLIGIDREPDADNVTIVISLVFAAGGVWLWYKVIRSLRRQMRESAQAVREAREQLMIQYPEEKNIFKLKKRDNLIFALCVVGIAAAIITVWGVRRARIEKTYLLGQELTMQGEYDRAQEVLRPLAEQEYKDSRALICLCLAHQEYENGEIEKAYFEVYKYPFSYQKKQDMQIIQEFKKQVVEEYHAICEEKKMLQKQQEEQKLNSIPYNLPYVGMPEKYIGETVLGKTYGPVEYGDMWVNGQYCTTHIYNFQKNGKVIYTACCVLGEVYFVRNTRNDPWDPVEKQKVLEEFWKSMQPDVSDYSHPEDFYENYYDDFSDYEEAEDYYYSHGGF